MNHTMISLEGTSATIGSEVTVISDRPADPNSIAGLSDDHGLFSYNLLTALSPDVRRTLID
jgi:alanine racemase